MKELIQKYPFLKSVVAFILGAIATYLGINVELPVNNLASPKIDSVKVITDSVKVDTLSHE